jgi:hypothetical protein
MAGIAPGRKGRLNGCEFTDLERHGFPWHNYRKELSLKMQVDFHGITELCGSQNVFHMLLAHIPEVGSCDLHAVCVSLNCPQLTFECRNK